MAHKLLEKKLKDLNRTDIEVFSCGTFAEDGEQSTHSAFEAMKEYGVDMANHKATNIAKSPILDMDRFCLAQIDTCLDKLLEKI